MRELIIEYVKNDGSIVKLRNNNWQAMDQINGIFEQTPSGYLRCSLPEIDSLTVIDNWTNFKPRAEQWILNCLRSAKIKEA